MESEDKSTHESGIRNEKLRNKWAVLTPSGQGTQFKLRQPTAN